MSNRKYKTGRTIQKNPFYVVQGVECENSIIPDSIPVIVSLRVLSCLNKSRHVAHCKQFSLGFVDVCIIISS